MKQMEAIVEAEIGKRINAFRMQKRMTLDQLAKQTGFTKGYLSKVEKSKKSPPVSTLWIIARALGVTISALLGEEAPRPALCLVRKNERPHISRDGTTFGYSYEAMAHQYPNKIMEPFLLTLPVKPKKRTVYQHEGEEMLFVMQGTMKFTHGADEYIVNEGDCIYFDSGIPHFGESYGSEEVKCFMVICNPAEDRERKV
ncbi:MAG: Cro/Cl family transcriptional regulator [Syntrophus sp. (in: bacteria)]|nr:Cro/Cl family transcriptional regulator [Syntrophus sp. (in: bacteria)]